MTKLDQLKMLTNNYIKYKWFFTVREDNSYLLDVWPASGDQCQYVGMQVHYLCPLHHFPPVEMLPSFSSATWSGSSIRGSLCEDTWYIVGPPVSQGSCCSFNRQVMQLDNAFSPSSFNPIDFCLHQSSSRWNDAFVCNIGRFTTVLKQASI